MIEYETEWVRQNSPDPADPTEVNWPERQARALIPFEVIDGRPLMPLPPKWSDPQPEIPRRGRNDMKYWGENPMADALVTATCKGVRYVLLIEREDGQGWAMPGGAIEPGERPAMAAARELWEETGLILLWNHFSLDAARWVPDPRGSMEAWAVTVVARCDLGEVDALPEVRGGDDARDARWISIWELRVNGGRELFPAHREILAGLK